jgi:hypothetical protein
VHDHIRGLSPFPGAWFEIGSMRVKALRSTRGEGQITSIAAPGTALEADFLAGRYRPPSLWSVLSVVRRIHGLGDELVGIMEAQYDTLREHGHSPSEAFNETVEELTESLIKLVAENGMDWMYANCSATAQRGALDWKPKFKKAVMPVFKELYERVANGTETRRVILSCGKKNYRELLGKELAVMGNSEMWEAGKATRALRPKEEAKANARTAKGIAGRQGN